MTKKDYILAAKIVTTLRLEARYPHITRNQKILELKLAQRMEDLLVTIFREDNARFDETRFRKACQ